MKRAFFALLGIFCAGMLFFAIPGKGEPAPVDIAGVRTAIWLPAEIKGKPVILFSHGFHACATQSVFLAQALVRAGYAVFAPNHADATCYGGASNLLAPPQVSLFAPERWDASTYIDRRADMETLLDHLPADPRYAALDWSRVGFAGHSLGGYAGLAMAGGWETWKEPRIKAVLAMSPFVAPFEASHRLGHVAVPVMYQGGTSDWITPTLRGEHGAYALTPAPEYYVEFQGAGHLDWMDAFGNFHEAINGYAVAFFDRFLKARPFPSALFQPHGVVEEFRSKQL